MSALTSALPRNESRTSTQAMSVPAAALTATKGYSFPVRPKLFTIDYLGGWTKVQKKFFDPNTGLMTKIEQSLGG